MKEEAVESLSAQSSPGEIPSAETLIGRAGDMIPDLLQRAPECEALRRVPEETIEEMKRNGLIRVCMPRKYGGYLLNGWATFSSGCHHADWVSNSSALKDGSGFLHILAPLSDGEIIDNWGTFALCSTGSHYVEFTDCFIPEHRTFPAQQGLDGTTPGAARYDDPVFRLPRLAIAPYSLVSVSIGIALGAVEQFVEAMRTRIN